MCCVGFWRVSVLDETGEVCRLLLQHVWQWKLMRVWGRPRVFETERYDWSLQARVYFDSVSQSMADQIDAVEAKVDRAIPLGSPNEDATENARKMFYTLTMLLQRPPLLRMRKVERGNRFEA